MNPDLKDKYVLITGVGIKPAQHVFRDITTNKPSHTPIKINGKEFKANIGAATALECAKAGATVHLVSRTEENLKIIARWIMKQLPKAKVSYSPIDLGNEQQLKKLVVGIPANAPLYWVQSVGLGAGTVKIKDDNPYLAIKDVSVDLVEAELSVLKDTIMLLKLLLPRFKKQEETRICIVSSMSAIRSIPNGSIHMAAKGAISRFANAATIELDKEKVFITDIRPGIVDTGLYDSQAVQNAVITAGNSYGFEYSGTTICAMPPSAVGKAIVTAFTSEGHITSINMVARGQWPHEGS